MADILFTHSYFLSFDPKEFRAMMPYPPLATITAASVLRSHGYSVAFHDVMLEESEDSIVESLKRHKPSIVICYDDSFNYLTKMCLSRMRTAAFRMASHAKKQGSSFLVFSSDAADHLMEYFDNNVDFVICGEAEQTLPEIVESLLRGRTDYRGIRGLAFRSQGTIIRTEKRPVLKDLDSLPIPAWDLVDIERYRSLWMNHHGFFSLNISTTRGCPFHCNWCAKPLYGQVYNNRSPRNVVEEMKFLRDLAHPDHLWITDDIFGLRPGWVEEFSTIVRQENIYIPFKCLSRADLLLEEETIQHLKLAGCASVWMGAESGSQRILDAMEKGTTVEQIIDASRLLHEHGIKVGFFLQFGYPGETWNDIEQTFYLVKKCQPEEIGVSVSYPLPGTPFFERVKADLGSKQNWINSQDLDLLFPGEYSRYFYRVLHRVVHKRFSIWKKSREILTILKRPSTIRFMTFRSLLAIVYHLLTLPFELRKLHNERDKPGIKVPPATAST